MFCMERHCAAERELMTLPHAYSDGFIYVAERDDVDVIKIGFSIMPSFRIHHIYSLCMRKKRGAWRVLAAIRGTIKQERDIHRALKEQRDRRHGNEFYPRSILSHPAIPQPLRVSP